jgi:hypothetical protein
MWKIVQSPRFWSARAPSRTVSSGLPIGTVRAQPKLDRCPPGDHCTRGTLVSVWRSGVEPLAARYPTPGPRSWEWPALLSFGGSGFRDCPGSPVGIDLHRTRNHGREKGRNLSPLPPGTLPLLQYFPFMPDFDPSSVPMGVDEEVGGTPHSTIKAARKIERRGHLQAQSEESLGDAWILIAFIVVLGLIFVVAAWLLANFR